MFALKCRGNYKTLVISLTYYVFKTDAVFSLQSVIPGCLAIRSSVVGKLFQLLNSKRLDPTFYFVTQANIIEQLFTSIVIETN